MSGKNTDLIRVAIVGQAGVGKTATVVKLISGRFIWNYHPTLEGVYKHALSTDVEDDPKDVQYIEIMDTAGDLTDHTEGVMKRDGYIRWADAFIVTYSITELSSFQLAKEFIATLTEQKKCCACLTLIGNKTDLKHQREVTRKQGEMLAAENACRFHEGSAKDDKLPLEQLVLDLCQMVKIRRATGDNKLRRRSSASNLWRKLTQKKLSI